MIRNIASLVIIYHLGMIMIIPNGASFLGRQTSWLFLEYARIVNMATNWALFAPDPANPIYMEFDIQTADGETQTGFLPKNGASLTLNPGYRRQLYFVRQMLIDPNKIERIFAPWLCRQHPEAEWLAIRARTATIPLLDQALRNADLEPTPVAAGLPSVSYNCRDHQEGGVFYD